MSVPPNTVAEFYSFSFVDANPSLSPPAGSFALTLSLTGANDTLLQGLLCTDSELDNNVLSYPDAGSLCSAAAAGQLATACTGSALLRNSGDAAWQFSHPVSSASTLHFVFAACATTSASMGVAGTWDCVNPGGENLPAGEIPLKALTRGFGIAWAVLTGLYLLNLTWVRATVVAKPEGELLALEDAQLASPIRPLHFALLLPPALFCAEGFVGAAYWRSLSAAGVGDLPLALGDAGAWDAASVALLTVVVALSRGWQVTRLHLSGGEWQSTGVLLFAYLGAWMWWSFVPSFLSLFALFLA